MRVRVRAGWALLLGGSVALLWVAHAWAQAQLPQRTATFTWDKTNQLHGTFSFRDAVDDPAIAPKLPKGLKVTVVMRGYVFPNGGGNPAAFTGHTCEIAYSLWDEVYVIRVNSGKPQVAVNKKGIYRLCTDLNDHPMIRRSDIAGSPSGYFLGVKVEVNPVSAATLQQVEKWVTRPTGASGSISPGDALFAAFASVFLKNLPTADKVVEFRTASLPP